MLHPHDDSHAYQFCPRCGGPLERRVLKATEPERPVCTRCGFVFYLDPKIAVGTIIRSRERTDRARPPRDRAGLRQVGVPRRLRRSRRAADLGRRSAKRARSAASTSGSTRLVNIYSYPGRAPVIVVYAATAIGGTLCVDDECLEAAEVETAAIPWDDLAFRSTHEGLRDYLDGSRHPLPRRAACHLSG